jgi:hypothetical protein
MSLEPGVDSFVTLEEADAYFAARPDSETWEGYEEQVKEAFLRAAYDRVTGSCLCDFSEIEDPDGEYTYTPEDAPPNIKKAQCEWALGLSKAEEVDVLSDTDLSGLKAGPVEFNFVKTDSSGYAGINDFIKSLLLRGGCACDFDHDSTNGVVIY